MAPLLYAPPRSRANPQFWSLLRSKKLDEWALSIAPVDLQLRLQEGCVILNENSFPSDTLSLALDELPGELVNFNTMDQFKCCDKTELLREVAHRIWQSIASGAAIANPQLLNRAIVSITCLSLCRCLQKLLAFACYHCTRKFQL